MFAELEHVRICLILDAWTRWCFLLDVSCRSVQGFAWTICKRGNARLALIWREPYWVWVHLSHAFHGRKITELSLWDLSEWGGLQEGSLQPQICRLNPLWQKANCEWQCLFWLLFLVTRWRNVSCWWHFWQKVNNQWHFQHIFTQQSKGTGEIEVTENGQVVKVKDVSWSIFNSIIKHVFRLIYYWYHSGFSQCPVHWAFPILVARVLLQWGICVVFLASMRYFYCISCFNEVFVWYFLLQWGICDVFLASMRYLNCISCLNEVFVLYFLPQMRYFCRIFCQQISLILSNE